MIFAEIFLVVKIKPKLLNASKTINNVIVNINAHKIDQSRIIIEMNIFFSYIYQSSKCIDVRKGNHSLE